MRKLKSKVKNNTHSALHLPDDISPVMYTQSNLDITNIIWILL